MSAHLEYLVLEDAASPLAALHVAAAAAASTLTKFEPPCRGNCTRRFKLSGRRKQPKKGRPEEAGLSSATAHVTRPALVTLGCLRVPNQKDNISCISGLGTAWAD